MWIFDISTYRFVEVNQAAIRHYGYSREEFLSMTIFDIRPEHEREKLREVLKQNTTWYRPSGVWEHLRKDGSCMWVETAGMAIVYNKRRCKLVWARDISDSVRASEQISQLSQELQYLKNIITDAAAVSICNTQGQITFVNQQFCKQSGYRAEELLGKDHRVLNAGYHRKGFWKKLWSTVNSGKPWHGEVLNRRKNGKLFWSDTYVFPFQGNNGTIQSFLSIRIDITDKKQKEEEAAQLNQKLLESQKELEKLSLVARFTKNIVFITDQQGRILWVNESFERMTGYSLQEVAGKPPTFLRGVSPEQPDETYHFVVSCLQAKKPFSFESVNYNKKGEAYYTVMDAQPFEDPYSGEVKYICVQTDITELKNKQNAIVKQNEVLKRIAWKQSHEVRRPLANVLALVELLEATDIINTAEVLGMLKSEANDLDKIIRDIVLFSESIKA